MMIYTKPPEYSRQWFPHAPSADVEFPPSTPESLAFLAQVRRDRGFADLPKSLGVLRTQRGMQFVCPGDYITIETAGCGICFVQKEDVEG